MENSSCETFKSAISSWQFSSSARVGEVVNLQSYDLKVNDNIHVKLEFLCRSNAARRINGNI